MMIPGARAILMIAALTLAGCGFRPLYGGVSGAARRLELSQIAVTPIESTLGSDMRNELIDRLTPSGEPAYPQYRLDITLHEYREGLGIQSDASVTRWNYQLTAVYQLTDLGTGKVVNKGTASSIASYSVVDSQFATLAAENDAKRRTAVDLGDELELRLALFFEQRGH
jgi:LPS-assembly lipoprotein